MSKGGRVHQQRRARVPQTGFVEQGRDTGPESPTAPDRSVPVTGLSNWPPARSPHARTALAALADQRAELHRQMKAVEFVIAQEVARERATGTSWVAVGAALGIARQGARQGFGETTEA